MFNKILKLITAKNNNQPVSSWPVKKSTTSVANFKKRQTSGFEARFLRSLKGVDLSKRRIPLMIKKASEKGPILWLCAAIHGDEVNGIAVVHEVFDYLKKVGLRKGAVYAFPLMNLLGFEIISRYSPYDEEDLNRNFPGKPQGSTAERIAYTIFSEIIKTEPTLVIDLHTAFAKSVSYIIIDQPNPQKNSPAVEEAVKYADKFGLIWSYETPETSPGMNTLTGSLIEKGIPAFTVELGGPNVIDKKFVREGVAGIKNLLKYLEIVDDETLEYIESPYKEVVKPIMPLKFSSEVSTPETSGILEYKVEPGQIIEKNQILARVRNVFGKIEEIIHWRGEKGVVLALEDLSVAFPGLDLFTIAVSEK